MEKLPTELKWAIAIIVSLVVLWPIFQNSLNPGGDRCRTVTINGNPVRVCD